MRITRLLLIVGLVLACAPSAFAQLKPDMLIVLDSSGSMLDEIPGSTGNQCNYGTTASQQQSKAAAALCAVQQMVTTNGDAYFGLMSYAGTSTSSPGRYQCAAEPSGAAVLQPLQTNNGTAIASYINGVGTVSLDGYFITATPIGGALQDARQYYEGSLATTNAPAPTASDSKAACRSLNVILITDGMEECIDCDQFATRSGCPKAAANLPGIYCGPNPDSNGNTDVCYFEAASGSSYHFDTAQERAWELFDETVVPTPTGTTKKAVRTYVVAFGVPNTGTSRQRIESIALAGGTDNPFDANNRAFYPQNAQELSAALAQIIADAQPPDETCNQADDDCDGNIDEGVPTFCDIPGGNPTANLCVSPGEQNCDGVDDDCDGVIDEGLLNSCGTCGDIAMETCDGVDNDCDSRVDEDADSGAMCGTDEGICEAGMVVCIAGADSCQGEVGPEDEACDCLDNDCDGATDENADGALCGTGQCVGCKCVEYCLATPEFGADCATGKVTKFLDNGACVCVEDNCDSVACAQSTIEREGKVACGPNVDGVGACRCEGGACAAPCDGVSCGSDQVCSPTTGRCVVNDCRGLGCDAGEICDPTSGVCEPDLCADAGCADDQVCRDGKCEATCAGVTCNDGVCRSGKCVADPCSGVNCSGSEVCNPATSECVENQCSGVSCGALRVCDPVSGDCEADPCLTVDCPGTQVCRDGECLAGGGGNTTGGGPSTITGGVTTDDSSNGGQVLATGGSGCSCQLGEKRSQTPSGLWFGLGLAAVLSARRVRRRGAAGKRRGLAALLAALFLLFGGCKVEPFCVDCVSTDSPSSGGGTPLSGGTVPTGGTTTGGTTTGGTTTGGTTSGGTMETDGGMDAGPACEPVKETCNDTDDDCDFKVDEGVRASENNCNQTGVCAGTRPTCLAGAFTCRFGDDYEADEVTCDGLDNDCDGRIDEAFPMLGTSCEIGLGACKSSGKQVCAATGLSLRCDATPGTAEEEVCDNVDNDCDGLIDEPKGNPGSAASYVMDDLVQIGAALWVYQYEASRPDADGTANGSLTTRACSRKDVMPWVNVTYTEAADACAAAGMTLCTASAWQDACNGENNSCLWSYTPAGGSACVTTTSGYPTSSGDAQAGMACNGHDVAAAPGAIGAGDPDDALKTTGAMPNCYTPQGGTYPDGPIFDLSGNAKEWVDDAAQTGTVRALRGGSYNDLASAMQCGASLSAANKDIRLATIGFRCCTTTAP